MVASLIVVGLIAPFKWPFLAAAFIFGVASFANVPPMQMRVMNTEKSRRSSPPLPTYRLSISQMRLAE